MTDFVLVPSGYDRVIGIVRASAPEFMQSPEFARLEGHGEDLPYVFMAEFAHFLRRAGPLSAQLLIRCHQALEEVAQLNEYAVDELLEDTIFENLLADDAAGRACLAILPGRLRAKADAWLARTR